MSKALYINADKSISYFYKFLDIKEFICTTIYSRNDSEFINGLIELYNSHDFKCDMIEFNNGINTLYFWKDNRIVYYYVEFDIFNYNSDKFYMKTLSTVDVFIYSKSISVYERNEYMIYLLLPIQCIEYNINKYKIYKISSII